MTGSFIHYLELLGLFLLLGIFASLAVKNINRLALILKLKPFILGSLLGVITTIPELSLGLQSTYHGVISISVGNLLGGSVFIFGFIIGLSLILNKQVDSSSRLKNMLPEALITFFPVVLGLDGVYGVFDGAVMLGLYLCVMYYTSERNLSRLNKASVDKLKRHSTMKVVLYSVIGIVMIMVVSRLVITVTIALLKEIDVKALALGTVVFSIGTNLPEISVMFVSWYKKMPEFSFSHLIGSAVANTLVLGILALIEPIQFNPGFYFQMLSACLGTMLLVLTMSKRLNRKVGVTLLGVYVMFLVASLKYLR